MKLYDPYASLLHNFMLPPVGIALLLSLLLSGVLEGASWGGVGGSVCRRSSAPRIIIIIAVVKFHCSKPANAAETNHKTKEEEEGGRHKE